MTPGASRQLTDRQAAVMERIDRRMPIKMIAQELGVSDTRINQHIRALKDIYEVSNLGDLVEEYRTDRRAAEAKNPQEAAKSAPGPQDFSQEKEDDTTSSKGAMDEAYSFSQVPASVFGFDMGSRDSAATVELNDVLPLIERAPWLKPGEPKVVPGLLDGEHAVTFRLAAIIGIAFGLLAAVVLTVTAAITISEALDGRATIPADEHDLS